MGLTKSLPVFAAVCVGTFWRYEDTYGLGATSYDGIPLTSCWSLCQSNSDCAAFDHEVVNGGRCWIHKHRIRVDQRLHKPGIDHYQLTRCIFSDGEATSQESQEDGKCYATAWMQRIYVFVVCVHSRSRVDLDRQNRRE